MHLPLPQKFNYLPKITWSGGNFTVLSTKAANTAENIYQQSKVTAVQQAIKKLANLKKKLAQLSGIWSSVFSF